MKERGLARPGAPGDQRVLGGALTEREVLQLGRAGAAQRDADFVGGIDGPDILGLGRDHLEWNADLAQVLREPAHLVEQTRRGGFVRRRFERGGPGAENLRLTDERAGIVAERDAGFLHLGDRQPARELGTQVVSDEREDAALGPAGDDAGEALG